MNNQHRLSNGITFESYPLWGRAFDCSRSKSTPKDLSNVLADPEQCSEIHSHPDHIYFGSGASDPASSKRFPVWFPVKLLSSHILIGGGIGSGKSTFLSRLIVGALQKYGSVVIGEAKAGKKGGKEGAAFTDLANYVQRRLKVGEQRGLPVYRWPRGNCYFNPLKYIKTPQDRKAFIEFLCNQLIQSNNITGDMTAFIYNAGNILEQILFYLQDIQTWRPVTLRSLLTYLSKYDIVENELETIRNKAPKNSKKYQQVLSVNFRLKIMNFFFLEQKEFVGTRHGVNLLSQLFEHEDLLYYSEPHPELQELELEKVAYQRCLVVVSQPLYDPASKVVGPLFWDSLLAYIIEDGPNPKPLNGKPRQKVLAVLDETHRLPVGRLGESGDFLREYNLGLVEITPTIVDVQRWQQNKHVYQTILSLSPGVPEISELMHSRLPNFFLKSSSASTSLTDGNFSSSINSRPDYKYFLGNDNPGVSVRSLQMAGKFTALLQSYTLDGEGKVFWLDLEEELLANLKNLFQEATLDRPQDDVIKALEYALGIAPFS